MEAMLKVAGVEGSLREFNLLMRTILYSKCDDLVKLKAIEKIQAITPNTIVSNCTFTGDMNKLRKEKS